MNLVPTDLLRGLERATPALKRICVTGWVLSEGLDDDRRALRAARRYWPQDRLERPGRVTVLGVVDELERLGVCRLVGREGDALVVERMEVAA